jgi:hypothetical protein
MKRERNPTAPEALLRITALLGGTLARGRHLFPKAVPAFRALYRRVPWQLLLLCLGLVVQAGLAFLVWQLVELCISLFEAWVMLARYSIDS